MSLLEKLSDPAVWEAFYAYRTSLACPKADTEELRRFIAERAFLPVTELIRTGGRFPLPRRAVISKMHSQKKRIVYIYPRLESRRWARNEAPDLAASQKIRRSLYGRAVFLPPRPLGKGRDKAPDPDEERRFRLGV